MSPVHRGDRRRYRPTCALAAALLWASACGAPVANRPAPLANRPAPVANRPVPPDTLDPETDCPGSGGGVLRADGKTYNVYLDVCANGAQRTARLLLRPDGTTSRTVEIIDTWTATADDTESYWLAAVIVGQTGTDAAILLHDGVDGTKATAWMLDGARWRKRSVFDAAHIWVEDRDNYARVRICSTPDPGKCDDNEILEDWTWDGTQVKRATAHN